MSQKEHSSVNKQAWSHKAYEAWHRGYGPPHEAAAKLRENPESTLQAYLKHFGDVQGKTVANLLGSHGRKAVALSLLGARVTIVDISEENERYAKEIAEAAGVSIDYFVSDVLEWPTDPFVGHFDFVLMECGILHYFVDLNPLAKLVHTILKEGGKLVLHEFHPLIKKLDPRYHDGLLALEGDYYSDEIVEGPAACHSALPQEEIEQLPQCRLRFWQLGEIVSAVSAQNLIVEALVESPHGEFPTLPGTFTLVARK